MESEEKGKGMFEGLNFETLEQDLGLVMGKGGASPSSDEKEKSVDTFRLDLNQKFELPEPGDVIEGKTEDSGVAKDDNEKPEKKKTEKGSGREDAVITEESPLFLHAATLQEEGILPTLNLDDLKGKSFSEALQIFLDNQKKYFEEGRDEYKNSLTERQRNYLDLIEKGVPDDFAENHTMVEDAYTKITDQQLADDEELQEQILIQNLRLKGLSDSKISVFVKAAKSDEKLFEEAKDAKDDILKYIAKQKNDAIKEAEEREQKAQAREEELKATIKSTVDSTNEILPGIKISANEKTKLFDLMTKPVEIATINGQKVPISNINKARSKDKILFDMRLNYFIEQGMFEKEFDLTRLSKKLTSSVASKLSQKLAEEPGGPSARGLTVEKRETDKKVPPLIFPKF